MKNVLVISDSTRGGAGIACRRLQQALVRDGRYAVKWFTGAGDREAADVVVADRPGIVELLLRRALPRTRGVCWKNGESARRSVRQWCNARDVSRCVCDEEFAAISLHNIHEFTGFHLLEMLPRDVPIVWTLHDMWPFTGYCCHSAACEAFASGSGCIDACPQAGNWGGMPASVNREWRRRDAWFARNAGRVVFVGPSAWMQRIGDRRFDGRVQVVQIANSIDLDVFRSRGERREVRRLLGLPEEKHILLFGAAQVEMKRKGFHHMLEAVKLLRGRGENDFVVVTFGWTQDVRLLPVDWIHVGRVEDERLLSLYYNAADAFVLPTLVDNLPNTLLESLASGTPAVVYDVGGCPEVVENGVTGFVVNPGTPERLADSIHRVLSLPPEERLRLQINCRRAAEKAYGMSGQACRYGALFDHLIGAASGVRRGNRP